MLVQVDQELDCSRSRVSCEGVIERLEVSAVERRQQLIAECSVNVKIFIVLSTLFEVLAEDRLLIKGGCTPQDFGSETRVGRAD